MSAPTGESVRRALYAAMCQTQPEWTAEYETMHLLAALVREMGITWDTVEAIARRDEHHQAALNASVRALSAILDAAQIPRSQT